MKPTTERPIRVVLNSQINLDQKQALHLYAAQEQISVSEAVRRAIDLLTKGDKKR